MYLKERIMSHRYLYLTMSFTTLITFIAVLPTMVRYSGNLYLVGDYMTQLIPFIKEGRRLFRSGTPFWSWNSYFGANFLGSYAYYLYGSPFFWPLVFLRENHLCIGITAIFILKHLLAGTTSYLYLSTHFSDSRYAVVGAMLYTFSSFTFDSTYYFIFLDAIAFFPLFLYFLDKALCGTHYLGFIFSVFINAVVNYYCFIATSVFFFIYLFFRIRYSNTYTWKNARSAILLYIAGVAMAAVILLPAAFTLLDTSRATGSFSKLFLSAAACIPQAIKLLRSLVLPSEGILGSGTGFSFSTFCSNAAFLPFFGAIFTVMALRSTEKNWLTRLLKALLILTFVPFGNGIFTLFSNLNYTRWWYALVMVMVLASLKILEKYENHSDQLIEDFRKNEKTVFKIAFILTVPLFAVKIICSVFLGSILDGILNESMMQAILRSGFFSKLDFNDVRYFAVLVIMTTASYGTLHILVRKKQLFNFKTVMPLVAVICAVSYLCYFAGDSNVFFANTISSPYVADTAASENIYYTDRTDFKISLNNYAMIVNRPSINTFNSFKSKATAEFARIAGFDSHSVTKKHFSTQAIQTVLSIATVVEKDNSEHPAAYYCPFGYVYDYYVLDENFPSTTNKEENNQRIRLMCNACILDSDTAEQLQDVVSLYDGNGDWKQACQKNRNTACTDFVMTGSGFTANSRGDHKRLIYFSVPNDPGWEISVNGEKAEIFTLNGGMIGIIVPEGNSTIQARFYPPMMKPGLILSCVSLIGVLAFGFIDRKKKYIHS